MNDETPLFVMALCFMLIWMLTMALLAGATP